MTIPNIERRKFRNIAHVESDNTYLNYKSDLHIYKLQIYKSILSAKKCKYVLAEINRDR